MRVVHINEHVALKGGVETYLHSLLPLLAAEGVEPFFVYDKGEGDVDFASERISGVGTASFKLQPKVRSELRSLLDRVRPDLVHVHNVQNVGVLQACIGYGPTVVTTHDYRLICPASNFFFKRTQEVCTRPCVGAACFVETARKRCLTPRPGYASYFYYRAKWATKNVREFAAVVAPSGGAQARLLAAGFDATNVSVLPYFCSVTPAQEPRPIPPDVTITFIGRTAPNKGAEYFVDALALLPEAVRGLIVGNTSGYGKELLIQRAERLGCSRRLNFRSWVAREDLPGILDNTSVLVFPSLWPETLGIVGLEAFSRGVPVVASDIGGVREWLRHAMNGFLVAPKSAEDIARSVEKLISSDERLKHFGTNAIETIRERFLPEHHVEGLLSLYRRVRSEQLRSDVVSRLSEVGG